MSYIAYSWYKYSNNTTNHIIIVPLQSSSLLSACAAVHSVWQLRQVSFHKLGLAFISLFLSTIGIEDKILTWPDVILHYSYLYLINHKKRKLLSWLGVTILLVRLLKISSIGRWSNLSFYSPLVDSHYIIIIIIIIFISFQILICTSCHVYNCWWWRHQEAEQVELIQKSLMRSK